MPVVALTPLRRVCNAQFPWLYAYNASTALDTEANTLSATGSGADAEHESSGSYQPLAAEEQAAKDILPELAELFPEARQLYGTNQRLAAKLALDRRNINVVTAMSVWIPSTVDVSSKQRAASSKERGARSEERGARSEERAASARRPPASMPCQGGSATPFCPSSLRQAFSLSLLSISPALHIPPHPH